VDLLILAEGGVYGCIANQRSGGGLRDDDRAAKLTAIGKDRFNLVRSNIQRRTHPV
jgi:hypothetical protein